MANVVNVSLNIKGLTQIMQTLNMKKEDIIRAAAFEVESLAKQKAPYWTGALSNSIYTITSKQSGFERAKAAAMEKNKDAQTLALPKPDGKHAQAIVGPCVVYAPYVEFGHLTKPFTKSVGVQNFVPARPFLVPAIKEVRKKFESGNFAGKVNQWKGLVVP